MARAQIARFVLAMPRSASPASHDLDAKIGLSKFHDGPKLWGSQHIFAGRYFFSKAKPYAAAPGAGLVGKPMGPQA